MCSMVENRRHVLRLLGSLAMTWPLAAKAQRASKPRQVAVLFGGSKANDIDIARINGFFEQSGWALGRELEVKYYWGEGETERNKAAAEEIARAKPDVVLGVTNSAMAALHRAKTTLPTVFVMVSDPVRMNYVETLARPGGNVTGFTPFSPELGSKWIEILKEISPGVQNIALIFNPEQGNNSASFSNSIKSTMDRLGVRSVVSPSGGEAELFQMITNQKDIPNTGFVFLPDAFT